MYPPTIDAIKIDVFNAYVYGINLNRYNKNQEKFQNVQYSIIL